ncbi:MAG: hypothetical protein OEQ28_09760, partial [Acidobacteriota bacterium]|nr:hypothetical protein [Acidobacteriota bacterium]
MSKETTVRASLIRRFVRAVPCALLNYFVIFVLTINIFYLSLLTTSQPLLDHHRTTLDQAISKLESKGFDREVFLLRRVATFRVSDNWLNSFVEDENAYAGTNFPFEVITLYPDFFEKSVDEAERAAI